jgi:hypothetical protein
MNFPDDANGDVLRRMEAAGDDLSKPHNLEFTLVFPGEDVARQFASHFTTLGYPASVEFTQCAQDLPWDVIITKYMVPIHEEIGTFESLLGQVAARFGGRNDGWGCLSER